MTRNQKCWGLIVFIYTLGFVSASLAHYLTKPKTYITEQDFGTLAEALQHGCELDQDRFEQILKDFYISHPLTKGTKK